MQLAELALLRYMVRIRCTCNKVTAMCHKMLQVQARKIVYSIHCKFHVKQVSFPYLPNSCFHESFKLQFSLPNHVLKQAVHTIFDLCCRGTNEYESSLNQCLSSYNIHTNRLEILLKSKFRFKFSLSGKDLRICI